MAVCGRVLVSLVALSFVVGGRSLASQKPFDDFKQEWKGKKVILVRPLYTVMYSATGALSPGTLSTRSTAITIASPEKGTYYYIEAEVQGNKSNKIADSDPDRLVTQLSAATANQNLKSITGKDLGFVTAAPAALLIYRPGTRMTVGDVFVRDQWVRLDLYDDFHPRGPFTTALLIEWPKKLTKEFTERSGVEDLIGTFLTMGADR